MTRLAKRHYVLETPHIEARASSSSVAIHHFISRTFSPPDLSEYLTDGSVIVFSSDMLMRVFTHGKVKDSTILLLSASATATKKSQAWMDIYEWKYRIIVWTRRILYYNLSAYKNIVYIEDAFGVEHYQYPISIKSLDILDFIAENTPLDITIVTSSPSLDLFATFPKAKIISKKDPPLVVW
jgi:hypothetical protein